MGEETVAEYECLRGWYADHSIKYGGWTSVHYDPSGLPEDLADRLLVVEVGPPSQYGPDLLLTKVVEVVERTVDRVVVRDTPTGVAAGSRSSREAGRMLSSSPGETDAA